MGKYVLPTENGRRDLPSNGPGDSKLLRVRVRVTLGLHSDTRQPCDSGRASVSPSEKQIPCNDVMSIKLPSLRPHTQRAPMPATISKMTRHFSQFHLGHHFRCPFPSFPSSPLPLPRVATLFKYLETFPKSPISVMVKPSYTDLVPLIFPCKLIPLNL